MAPRRLLGLGALATGVVCPCHALVGVVSLAVGASMLSPDIQDGIHAIYAPAAVLAGALMLRASRPSQNQKVVE